MCGDAFAGGHGAGTELADGEIVRRCAENAGRAAEKEDVRDVGHPHGTGREAAGSVVPSGGGRVFV